jgi:polyhydroxyalkanoate synthesis regulator phasin
MGKTRRFWLVLGSGVLACVLVAALFGSAALANSNDASLGQTFIDRLATRLGITSDELTTAVKDTQLEMLDEAVTSGRLTQQQADTLRQRIESGDDLPGFGFGPGFGHAGQREGRGLAGCINLDTVAQTLGLTTAELRSELESGSTLSEIITAHGQTVESVVNALVAEARSRLDEAVAAGQITQEQADALLAELPARLTDMIQNGLPAFNGHHWRVRGWETT